MGFPIDERNRLLAVKGVGPTVIERLEQIGIVSLSQLAREDAASVTRQIAQMVRASCWHNSPQSHAAITAAIALARDGTAEQS